MPVQVIFEHDDTVSKWTVKVIGVKDSLEARQAFTAVILTNQTTEASMQKYALVKETTDGFEITPAI